MAAFTPPRAGAWARPDSTAQTMTLVRNAG